MTALSDALQRLYVPAKCVAEACGIDLVRLDNRLRPESWGAPRDFIAPRGELQYAEQSLPQLATALRDAGESDAAAKLTKWLSDRHAAAITHPEPRKSWLNRWEDAR